MGLVIGPAVPSRGNRRRSAFAISLSRIPGSLRPGRAMARDDARETLLQRMQRRVVQH